MGSEPQPLQTPSLPQVLAAALDAALEDVHTCSWGSVLSYDAASQTCSVQLIQRRAYTDEDGERQTERPAPLLGVPVLFPGSGPYSITWPIAPGDVVLLVFMERAMDAWHASGQSDVDAGDDRRHSLTDAVAIPGLRSAAGKIAGPPPNDSVCVTAPKIQLGSKNATKAVARNGDSISVSITDLQTCLDDRYAFNNPSTPVPLAKPVGGNVSSGSSKVKADD